MSVPNFAPVHPVDVEMFSMDYLNFNQLKVLHQTLWDQQYPAGFENFPKTKRKRLLPILLIFDTTNITDTNVFVSSKSTKMAKSRMS